MGPNFSFKKMEANIALSIICMSKYDLNWRLFLTYPNITLSAPSGVTKIGGANEYAEKFKISPTATIIEYDEILRGNKPLLIYFTSYHSCPPCPIL